MLLTQLVTVVAVVAVCSVVFGWISVQQLRASAEQSALNIARTLAEDPDVQRRVAFYSADPGTPSTADLRDDDLQRIAKDVTARTGALFVVITDDHGIRLAHPRPEQLGERVSTGYQQALAGNEVVAWETGTLGESARAKVPVYPVAGGDPIGEVSVGFERESVFSNLPLLLGGIGLAAGVALLLAAVASTLVRRRFRRLTLDLQPEELVALVQNQAAVLDGVGDGVVAVDTDGAVRVCNRAAERMLGADALGRPLADLGLDADLLEAARRPEGVEAVIGGRVAYVDVHPVVRDGRDLGEVIVLRDRTDVEALAARLASVQAMTEALRVQRHEFANRMHVAAGLLDAERAPDARAFLGELLARGAVDPAVPGIERVPDAFLQSVLGAKADAARERGVQLRVSEDTLVPGEVHAVEDVSAVLGNLVDNAVQAAHSAAAPEVPVSPVVGASAAHPQRVRPEPWVEVGLFADGAELVMTVSDSGTGIDEGVDPFARGERTGLDPDAVHGRGFGLTLSRDLARRRGGDVWIIDRGGPDGGAVFGARMPGALAPSGIGGTSEDRDRTDALDRTDARDRSDTRGPGIRDQEEE
ncbi:sensor histidine kinase [Microbacterium bovistercoris]|uniref:histidine kinase n=2 Tax=Microbacterium bovistercoris TaxID=2293570 RepID=A0A371NY40_9MICO|nr:sensor histidine kinase [Microbacterium bovistercoris]